MNKLYFWLYAWVQVNKLKWYLILTIVALLLFVFSKSSFWYGVSCGFLILAVPYFIWVGYQKIKNKKPNKEQTVQVSDTTGDAMKN